MVGKDFAWSPLTIIVQAIRLRNIWDGLAFLWCVLSGPKFFVGSDLVRRSHSLCGATTVDHQKESKEVNNGEYNEDTYPPHKPNSCFDYSNKIKRDGSFWESRHKGGGRRTKTYRLISNLMWFGAIRSQFNSEISITNLSCPFKKHFNINSSGWGKSFVSSLLYCWDENLVSSWTVSWIDL